MSIPTVPGSDPDPHLAARPTLRSVVTSGAAAGRMAVEPVSPVGPPLPGRALLRQRWEDLVWAHWPVEPSVVAPLLPPGCRPDVLDDRTWVGLVPFRMRGIGLTAGPAVPLLGSFPEINVRLYSVGPDGRRGVVFRSLDATRLLPVVVARAAFGLPYVWSRARVRATGPTDRPGTALEYRVARRRSPAAPPAARSTLRVRVGEPVVGDELDHFLTARWGYHAVVRGRTVFAPVLHEPWPIHAAELLELDDELVAAAGLPAPTEAPHVRCSPGVDVVVGRPRPVGSAP